MSQLLLTTKLKKLPDAPGVYLFFNIEKELIYVGKATSLRSRVRSYFNSHHPLAPSSGRRGNTRPIEQMMHEVVDIKWEVTDSALEAIILEGKYIKEKQPKYNVDWRDDKSWNYLVITKDKFPKVLVVRQHELDGRPLPPPPTSPSGRERDATNDGERLPRFARNDKVGHSHPTLALPSGRGGENVFGPYPGLNTAATLKILRNLFLYSTCSPGQTRPCFYRQIGLCLGVCDGGITPAEYRLKVINPLKLFLSGKKKSLLRSLNTKMIQASRVENFEEAGRLRNQIKALGRIQDIALLNKSFTIDPTGQSGEMRIEGYDISNLGATGKVGSMVVFKGGVPFKSDYRKFNIKTVVGQSDVDCLKEVLTRRLKHSEWPMPTVFLIDGGVPQVGAVKSVLNNLKIDIPVVGIAKGARRKRNDLVVAGTNVKIQDMTVPKWAQKNLEVLIKVRDEAHRFAIKFQREKRKL
ncbi:MAG: hypothetical protein A2538_00695 [Candidatus Magasanikbacteria bacterium RIFOXYD2_FULL_41_14]|uniref:Excinuclease ABC subunit C n=1 Tax=Candidatus Magasanikbacteria bacterium RIFOXYD2_FULL_41_14 TaxID=1798709 RepID=A0A1F6PEA1_9BACT|nr:MAG: hypothetical protein A2538_00695 [Candidatus Magasanikbacteria bacterium RIFOXYD2_FULL_41_14]